MPKQNYASDGKQPLEKRISQLQKSGLKYLIMDVHQEATVNLVYDGSGRILDERVLATQPQPLLEYIGGIKGEIRLVFEEGTQANWLYDLLCTKVKQVLVCDPRHNHLLKVGNKSDKLDVRKLGALFRSDMLKPVFKQRLAHRNLRELERNYSTLVKDTTRMMNRIKAIYRGRAIRSSSNLYCVNKRQYWLGLLSDLGIGLRAEHLFKALDYLRQLRQEARAALLKESHRHKISRILETIPQLGPIRVAQIMAIAITPDRFRTKRQFWCYLGLAVVTRTTSDFGIKNGQPYRRQKAVSTRGLNQNHNPTLKEIFKSAATAAVREGVFKQYYERSLAKGIRPEMIRLSVARKLSAITLAVWKKGEKFDPEKINKTA
jgi:transposase